VKVRNFRDERSNRARAPVDAGVPSIDYADELRRSCTALHLDETPLSNDADDVLRT
jgi:hypothetical protein